MWLVVALLAQFILGTSAVFDKLLLRRGFFNPWAYTFWLGVLGLFSLSLLPLGLLMSPTETVWGFIAPPLSLLFTALGAGAVFIVAMLFLFRALGGSEASTVLPFIGALSAIATLILGYFLIDGILSRNDLIGFSLLVSGGLVLFTVEERALRATTVLFVLLSAASFGAANVLTKLVFDQSPFIAGFILVKLGGVLLVLLFLLPRSVRKNIFRANPVGDKTSNGANAFLQQLLYFANRAYAAFGSLLVNAAIFLAHPALVDATGSFKYVVILLFAWGLLKEHFYGRALTGKLVATACIVAGLVVMATGQRL